jgi:hypothetical protein
VSLLIVIIMYSDIHGHFMPIKRPGILTLAFSLDVTPCDVLNFFSANLNTIFKTEYYLTSELVVGVRPSLDLLYQGDLIQKNTP